MDRVLSCLAECRLRMRQIKLTDLFIFIINIALSVVRLINVLAVVSWVFAGLEFEFAKFKKHWLKHLL